MSTSALFLLTAHHHAVSLAPLSAAAQISGFLLVLLATGVIVLAIERLCRG
jgi:hypothetical protein